MCALVCVHTYQGANRVRARRWWLVYPHICVPYICVPYICVPYICVPYICVPYICVRICVFLMCPCMRDHMCAHLPRSKSRVRARRWWLECPCKCVLICVSLYTCPYMCVLTKEQIARAREALVAGTCLARCLSRQKPRLPGSRV